MGSMWFWKFLFRFFVLCFLMVFARTAISPGCDISGLNCISCTQYQTCTAGISQGRIVSCRSGNDCADDKLKQCQMKLNCYALNECMQAGIFPDVMVDSNYFVCLSDGGTGYLKYEFTCPDGHFFEQSGKICIQRSVTAVDSPSDPTTAPPDPTTAPPDPTTAPPDPTTAPPDPTTAPPDPTTAPPDPTTAPPDPTTAPPDPTTAPPDPTTAPPDPTTAPPDPTTAPPDPTTAPPDPTTAPPDPTTAPPSQPPTSVPPTQTPPFVCPGPGVFANPDNCKMYYRCSTSLKLFYYICPGRSYFNSNILKCSMVITLECQEQILKNSKTAIPTAPTPPPSTTTTTLPPPPPPTTTTTTATTLPPTTITTTLSPPTTQSTSFSCPMAGLFENATNCKTYYRCSTSGKAFLYVCPGATYFNEITKRCSLTVTSRCRKLIQG